VAPVVRTFGYDAFAYWSVDQASPYTRSAEVALGGLGSFLYPPIAALAAAPFAALPWWVFLTLSTSLLIGTLI
jgi:hypothetical protein